MQTQMLAGVDPAAATEPEVAEAFGKKPVTVFKIECILHIIMHAHHICCVMCDDTSTLPASDR